MKTLIILFSFILVSCGTGISDFTKDLSGDFYYYRESAKDKIIVKHGYKEGDEYIPCKVLSYSYNDKYILVAQEPIEDCFWGEGDLGNKKGYAVNFWIISHEKNQIIGPLSLSEYIEKRKSLNIPENLKLNMEL